MILLIRKMNIGKSPRADNITLEMIKYLGESGFKLLHETIHWVWKRKQISEDWKLTVIITIH